MPQGFRERNPVTENIITSKKAKDEELRKRVEDIREDDAENTPSEKNYYIGIQDIEKAFDYYIKEVIQPYVISNGERMNVPIIYGSPERWISVSKDGFYRDHKSKIMLPLIMYRKTNIVRNENMFIPRLDQLLYVSRKKWDKKNRYDNFHKMTKNKDKSDRYVMTYLPDYVNIEIEGIIWTSFVEQLNGIIEKMTFASSKYWGDDKKFKFITIITDFSNTTELSAGTERMVRANFNATMYGYILTEEFKNLNTSKISLAPKKVVFTEERTL